MGLEWFSLAIWIGKASRAVVPPVLISKKTAHVPRNLGKFLPGQRRLLIEMLLMFGGNLCTIWVQFPIDEIGK